MNDILTEREACAKIADGFQDSTWIATSHNYGKIVGYRDACKDISAAIRARPTPEPIINDEMIERAARGIYDKHNGIGAFDRERMRLSAMDVAWPSISVMSFYADARAALVAALGGK